MATFADRAAPPGAHADPRPHAVVIGAGFGGLAAAVRLGARGWRVTILEKQDQPGGRAAVFRRNGFTWDAGPTILTAPFLFEELWALCGRRLDQDVTLKRLDPLYRIRFDDGSVFDARGTSAAMWAEVARLSPADLPGFERFMALSEEMCRIGFQRLGHTPFSRLSDMLRVTPDLIRLQAWRSVHATVARYLKDERLRIAFSFHPLLIGGNPFAASSIYALISALEQRWGVHWPMGGTGRLVQGLVGLIEGQGGALRLNSEVARIDVAGGRATGVTLADGSVIAADIVVSNADAAFTYGRLLAAAPRRHWTDRRLARTRQSMGLFVWYFGTRRRFDGVPHHLIVLGPRYHGLLDDIFRRKVLAEDFSLYLHRPTASDPAMAPEGCDCFYVLSPVPHLDSGVDWAARAEPYRAAIASRLEATVMPGLAEALVESFVMTPQDFHDRLLATRGAAFGLEPILTQSAWFRPHNRSEDFSDLYLVGAGTHPGAGVPGVLSSAKVLDAVVPHAHASA
jgi:phytoene desaturase